MLKKICLYPITLSHIPVADKEANTHIEVEQWLHDVALIIY